jgi:ABC-2 type transport system permease protein
MFWEFFRFEMRFRLKSPSTYVYFLLWTAFSFLCVASESFGPIGFQNGKVLLNGPYANSFNAMYVCLFGIIVMAAIFRHVDAARFPARHVSRSCSPSRSPNSPTSADAGQVHSSPRSAFSGSMLGTFLGTLAPWADHARIGPNHLWWYLQPFLSIVVIQIFFIGSLFFAIAALTRKIFIVYLQGVALFMLYVIGSPCSRRPFARALLVRDSRSGRAADGRPC